MIKGAVGKSLSFTAIARVWVAAAAAMSTASPALANLTCTQKVVAVTVNPDGALWVEFSGSDPAGRTVMCNVNGTITAQVGGSTGNVSVTPETCKAWVSMFLTAKSTQQNIVMRFDSTTLPSCAGMPNFRDQYPVPFPYWISLSN
jgi:hypothetical protein